MTPADLGATFALRLATRENVVTLETLERDYGITPRSVAEAMDGTVAGWLTEADGRAAAFAMADRATGEVLVVAVLPEREGQGHGRAVLGAAVRWLRAAGRTEPWLLANPDPRVRATGFYDALGWRRTGERRGEDEMRVLPATVPA